MDRIEQADGGYQVWLDGSDHCFWVPDYRWDIWPLHIGISVVFGGFWNPLGYYNIYDYGYPYYGGYYGPGYYGGYYGGGYYGGGYYGGYAPYYSQPYGGHYGGGYATSYLRGYVDRFDDYNGTIVLRDDESGRYVTVYVSSDSSRFRTLQVGNWVVLSGSWTRDGYFEAFGVEEVR